MICPIYFVPKSSTITINFKVSKEVRENFLKIKLSLIFIDKSNKLGIWFMEAVIMEFLLPLVFVYFDLIIRC